MKRVFVAIAIMVMALVGTTATMQAAYDFLLQIEGIDGEAQVKEFAGAIEVLAYDWGIVSPRDPASGQATGKRMHKPFVVTKRIDKTTPHLVARCATGEHIKKATLILRRTGAQGAMETFIKIELRNVLVTSIANFDPDVDGDGLGERTGSKGVERVSFVYEQIALMDGSGGLLYVDDWSTP